MGISWFKGTHFFSYSHMQILWLTHHNVSSINHQISRVISPNCIMIFCIVTVIFPHCWFGSSRLSNWFFALLESFFSAVSPPSGILRRSVELNNCNCIVSRCDEDEEDDENEKNDDEEEWKGMKMMKKR